MEVRKDDGSFESVLDSENVVQLLQESSRDTSVKSAIKDLLGGQVSENPDTQVQGESISAWDSPTEKLLVDPFKNVDPAHFLGSLKWKANTTNINRLGYSFTPEQCRLKINTVKEKCEHETERENMAGGMNVNSVSEINLGDHSVTMSNSIDHLPDIGQILSSSPEPSILPEVPEHSYSATIIRVREPKSTWNEFTKKLLLEQLKNMNLGKFSKAKWKSVTENINHHGYRFTNEQVRLKAKALKERYILLKKKSLVSPSDPPDESLPYLRTVFSYIDDDSDLPENSLSTSQTTDQGGNAVTQKKLTRGSVGFRKSSWDAFAEKVLMEQLKIVGPGPFTPARKDFLAESLKGLGYYFTNRQIIQKVRSLKSKYIRLKNSSPADKLPSYPPHVNLSYMKTVFPDLDEDSVSKKDSGQADQSSSLSTAIEECVTKEAQTKSEQILEGPSPAKQSKRSKKKPSVVPSSDELTNILEMKEYLESLFVRRETAVEKRHKEKMALLGSFVDVLKQSVTNSNNSRKDSEV